MPTTTPTTREELNRSDPNRLAMILRKLRFGEVLNRLFGGGSVSVPAATVGADIEAFTDPPEAAEMALLRTFVNALKADLAALRTAVTSVGGATETGVTVTSNVATLAATPTSLLVANATSATTTGVKELLVGPTTGPNALVPKTGQCVWDGGVQVLFSADDVVTVAAFTYTTAADTTASALQSVVDTQ